MKERKSFGSRFSNERPSKTKAAPVPDGEVHALLNIDLRNAFNEANRHAGFDAIYGKTSRTYGDGRVQIGDQLPHLTSMHVYFPYFKAMHH